MQADKKGKLTIEIVINLYFIKYITFINNIFQLFFKAYYKIITLTYLSNLNFELYKKNLMDSIIEFSEQIKKNKNKQAYPATNNTLFFKKNVHN